MKKKDVIKFLGQKKSLTKDMKVLERKIEKLKKAHLSVSTIINHLESIVVVDDVPIQLFQVCGGFNISSPFDESNRSAFLATLNDVKKHKLTLYTGNNNPMVFEKELSKKDALVLAARWIDKGELT